MKNRKHLPIGLLSLFMLLGVSTLDANSSFDISEVKRIEIETRVNQMNYSELIQNKNSLIAEQALLAATQDTTQSPSANKAIGGRLKEISSELTLTQKALAVFVGIGAISALTDDGYNDDVPPVITVNGSNPATVELGATYTDQGATALDANHGSTSVATSGSVNTSTVGSYTLTYTATDLDNNTATATRTVNVVDTTAPVITVVGDNPVTNELGVAYTDAGASVTDLSGSITPTTDGEVDVNTVGSYTLTYTATDASGNEATAVTRTVNVVDTTSPVFTSSSTFTVAEGVTDIGDVTATDLADFTFTIGATSGPPQVAGVSPVLTIRPTGALKFSTAPDYDLQVPDKVIQVNTTGNNPNLGTSLETLSGYQTGATMDFTATVTVTDASGNTTTQNITVQVSDVGGVDDDTATGTGTGTGTGTVDVTAPVFTSSNRFDVPENVTAIGTVTATDYGTVTFAIGATEALHNQIAGFVSPVLQITSAGALTFSSPPDYDLQVTDQVIQVNTTGPNPNLGTSLETYSGYQTGAVMKFRATVTATDDAGNAATQTIVVRVSDVGGADDDTATQEQEQEQVLELLIQ